MSKRTWKRLAHALNPTWVILGLPAGQSVVIRLTDGGLYNWHVVVTDWEHKIEHQGRCSALTLAKSSANISLNRSLVASRVVTEGYVHSTLKGVLVSYEMSSLGGIDPPRKKRKRG